MRNELKTSGNVREVLKVYAATCKERISIDGVYYAFEKLAGQMPKAFPCLYFSENNYSKQLENILFQLSVWGLVSISGGRKEYNININKDVLLKQLSERKDDERIIQLKEMGQKFSDFLEEYAQNNAGDMTSSTPIDN